MKKNSDIPRRKLQIHVKEIKLFPEIKVVTFSEKNPRLNLQNYKINLNNIRIKIGYNI